MATVSIALLAGCTVKDVDAPALAGPSTFAMSITATASPDVLTQDGVSQSTISVKAVDANGVPTNIALRADILVDGVVQDYGRLSTKQLFANSTLTYTSPPANANPATQVPQTVTIQVTPVEAANFRGTTARQVVDIRLVPQGIILPVNPNLIPQFTVTPASPEVMAPATFDASATTNAGTACGLNCSYTWNFGDGSSGTGQVTTHQYRAQGIYVVTLTVTDARGAQAVKTSSRTIAPGTPPTPAFTFSPTPAVVDQTIFFNATTSKAAPGRTIVSYEWDFGKGTGGTGVTVSKAYDTPGTYTVTLKTTDDAGTSATVSQTVAVNSAQIQPNFTVEPAGPVVGQSVIVNASSTTSTAPIVSYSWNFGANSTPSTGTGTSASTQDSVSGSKVITLTVTDNAGRTASISKVVTVSP